MVAMPGQSGKFQPFCRSSQIVETSPAGGETRASFSCAPDRNAMMRTFFEEAMGWHGHSRQPSFLDQLRVQACPRMQFSHARMFTSYERPAVLMGYKHDRFDLRSAILAHSRDMRHRERPSWSTAAQRVRPQHVFAAGRGRAMGRNSWQPCNDQTQQGAAPLGASDCVNFDWQGRRLTEGSWRRRRQWRHFLKGSRRTWAEVS